MPPNIMRFPAFLLALTLLVLIAPCARGDDLPRYTIEDEVFEAQLVVVASPAEGNTVEVKEVLLGTATVGQKLPVERWLDLPRLRFESIEEAWASGRRSNISPGKGGLRDSPAQTLPKEANGDVLLFLEQDEKKVWRPAGWGSGVKWLLDGKVYGYQQLMNPGGYYLLPDERATTQEELRTLVGQAIAKNARYLAAVAIQDPAQKVEQLKPFVLAKNDGRHYFHVALRELSNTGPAASAFLREQADTPNANPMWRLDFLPAYIKSGDPDAAPYLLDLVERAAPIIRASGPFERDKLSQAERQTLFDWFTALDALAEMGDKRVVPALREALLWGAVNWKQDRTLEIAARSLANLPSPENVPFFAQALASIPADEYDWAAVYSCLQALRKHPYPSVIPILINQLDFPKTPRSGHDSREYNARIAHQILVELTGQDLGKEKQAWLQWLQTQPQTKKAP